MDDDGDMAEMCLTEKKKRSDTNPLGDLGLQIHMSDSGRAISESTPPSPERSIGGVQMVQRAFSNLGNLSKHGSLTSSSDDVEKIEPLEMLLEAYFVVIDNTLTKSLSVREFRLTQIYLLRFIHAHKYIGINYSFAIYFNNGIHKSEIDEHYRCA